MKIDKKYNKRVVIFVSIINYRESLDFHEIKPNDIELVLSLNTPTGSIIAVLTHQASVTMKMKTSDTLNLESLLSSGVVPTQRIIINDFLYYFKDI